MLLQNCVIEVAEDAPARIDIVLLHHRFGAALLDVPPHLTLDAVDALRRRLDKAHFATAFPGYLPMAHLRLGRLDLPRLPELLAEAFAGQPPLSLPGGDTWMPEVRRILQDPVRLPAPAETRIELLTSAQRGWFLLPVAAGLALASGLGALAWPRLNGPPPDATPVQIQAPDHPAPNPAQPWPQSQPPSEQDTKAASEPAPLANAAAADSAAATGGSEASGDTARTDAPDLAGTAAAMQAKGITEAPADPPPAPAQPPADPPGALPAGAGSQPVPSESGGPPLAEAPNDDRHGADTATPPPGTAAAANPAGDAPATAADHEAEAGTAIGTATTGQPEAAAPAMATEPAPPGTTTPETTSTKTGTTEAAAPALPKRPDAPPPATATGPEQLAATPQADPAPPAATIDEAAAPSASPALPSSDPDQPSPGTPEPAKGASTTEPAAAAALPTDAPPATERDAASTAPATDTSRSAAASPAMPTGTAPPASAAPAPPPHPRSTDPARIAVLMRRGDALLALGDISGARRFYERAAEAGSADAAMAAGRTHDPAALAALGVRGIRPDPEAAAAWYRRAEALRAAEPDAPPQHGATR